MNALGLAALAFPFACLDWFLTSDFYRRPPLPSFETCIGRLSLSAKSGKLGLPLASCGFLVCEGSRETRLKRWEPAPGRRSR